MRKVRIERKLFELFGYKFLVFENFVDSDLNIDDESIYGYEDQNLLVDIFVSNKFYSIWSDERRHNASVICACDGNLSVVINFLNSIKISTNCYSTFDCDLGGEDNVLYITSQDAMHIFAHNLLSSDANKKSPQAVFFAPIMFPLRKSASRSE